MAASTGSETQVVRLKKGKTTFEILCKPGAVQPFRDGQLASIDHVLFTDVIFTNQRKGNRASASELKDAFDTTDERAVLELILNEGALEVNAAERKEKLDQQRRALIHYIHKNFLNPLTNLPHPPLRIDQALTEVKFRVDMERNPERQATDAIKKLLGILAFKKSEIEGTITVTHQHVGPCNNVVYRFASIKDETYTGEGVVWHVGLPPGDFDEFLAAMNKTTKGDFQWRAAGAPAGDDDGAAAGAAAAKGKKGKKKGKGRK